jgi:hypothetical protein
MDSLRSKKNIIKATSVTCQNGGVLRSESGTQPDIPGDHQRKKSAILLPAGAVVRAGVRIMARQPSIPCSGFGRDRE